MDPTPPSGDLTADTFFNGRLRVFQPRGGYRFSLDAVLLAGHAVAPPDGRLVDLGTGCGIIALLLAFRHPGLTLAAVELQAPMAALARHNARVNGLAGRVRVLETDLKAVCAADVGGPVDAVVCNPPFRKVAAGRINPDGQRAAARHEILATLADVVRAAARLVRAGGVFTTIYPAERTTDLLVEMRAARIEPKWLRPVLSRAGEDARLILVQGRRDGRPGMKLRAPLVIYAPGGGYTTEVAALFAPGAGRQGT